MKKVVLTLVLLVFGTCYAYPQGSNHHNNTNNVTVGPQNNAQSVSVGPQTQSVSVGPQSQTVGVTTNVGPQTQSVDVNANSQAAATASGNVTSSNQSVSFSSPHQAPAVFGGYVFPTASCESAGNLGLSGLTGGLTFGGTHRNRWCQKLETARFLFEMGHEDAAIQLICSMKFVKNEKNIACSPHREGQWKWNEKDRADYSKAQSSK